MTQASPPFCMERLEVSIRGEVAHVPFGASDDEDIDGHIPWTTFSSEGLEISLSANVSYSTRDKPHRTRLDLSMIKNGEKFRTISYGPLLLCDETEGSYPGDKTFFISFGAWE